MFIARLSFRILALCLSCLLIVVSGCSDTDERIETQVTGSVTIDGKPLEDGKIQFTSSKTGEGAIATLEPGGKYELYLPKVDLGVTYSVTVSSATEEVDNPIAALEKPKTQEKNSIPLKYTDRQKSGLTAVINSANDNEFNFELSSK